ncbi:hypothetical protein [Salinihabitans flavidus]|uniref:hypothetical protein n=1 Tax=Salinihabitans flavidus TaxID=569882 RepID=UPI001113B395|nr:hypothetical protein [Salinihabitans flavidus]
MDSYNYYSADLIMDQVHISSFDNFVHAIILEKKPEVSWYIEMERKKYFLKVGYLSANVFDVLEDLLICALLQENFLFKDAREISKKIVLSIADFIDTEFGYPQTNIEESHTPSRQVNNITSSLSEFLSTNNRIYFVLQAWVIWLHALTYPPVVPRESLGFCAAPHLWTAGSWTFPAASR